MTEQDRFNEALVEIAREMMSLAANLAGANDDWTEAFCDAQFDPHGGSSLSKCRVKMKDGNLISIEVPMRTYLLLNELWELRDSCLTNSWYGLTVVVTPGGDCQTRFNFDPNCIGDPHFFEE